jgi:hypothetical protein
MYIPILGELGPWDQRTAISGEPGLKDHRRAVGLCHFVGSPRDGSHKARGPEEWLRFSRNDHLGSLDPVLRRESSHLDRTAATIHAVNIRNALAQTATAPLEIPPVTTQSPSFNVYTQSWPRFRRISMSTI